jgi:hypothetical protein
MSGQNASARSTKERETARGGGVLEILDDHVLLVFIVLIVLLSMFSYVIGLANV